MPTKKLLPKEDTDLGKLLYQIFNDHPIVRSCWEKEVKSFRVKMTDRQILKSLVDEYNRLTNITYQSMTLPYSLKAHIKLSNVLKYKRLN